MSYHHIFYYNSITPVALPHNTILAIHGVCGGEGINMVIPLGSHGTSPSGSLMGAVIFLRSLLQQRQHDLL